MFKDILLSICIPTYNRPFELSRLLKSIFSQISPEVEVVIGDDSDNPETEEMIKKKFPTNQIQYQKNEHQEITRNTSLNFDKNILGVTERANGKYVWWFGDDDEMEPGAIAHALDIIKKHPEISFIFVNLYPADQNIENHLGKSDKFFRDEIQVLEEISNELGFISSILFKKGKLSNINKENIKKFIGLGFINFYLVMYILSCGGRFYHVNYPYVRCHPTPAGKASYDGFQIFGINFYKIAIDFQDKFDKKIIKKMLAKNFGHVWRGILVGWLKGYDTPKKKLWPMFKLYWNFPEFWLAAPFFLMPKFLTKFAHFIYKKVLKRAYSTVK